MEVYLHFGPRLHGLVLDIFSFTEILTLHSDDGLCTVLAAEHWTSTCSRNVSSELMNGCRASARQCDDLDCLLLHFFNPPFTSVLM